jgi:hypothetical protein
MRKLARFPGANTVAKGSTSNVKFGVMGKSCAALAVNTNIATTLFLKTECLGTRIGDSRAFASYLFREVDDFLTFQ